HRAVLARVEVVVFLIRKCGEVAAQDRRREDVERLLQPVVFVGEIECETRRFRFAGNDRLDRAAHLSRIDTEEFGNRHRIHGELQSNAAIDLLAEVLMTKRFARLVVDDAEARVVLIDAIDLPFDANGNAGGVDDERLGEFVLEVTRAKVVCDELREIARDEVAEDALRGVALDRADVAIERRRFRLESIELGVDGVVESCDQCIWKQRQSALRGFVFVVSERAVEMLEDAVIDAAFVAMIDLQFALGIVEVVDAENVLEEELLGTLAEVFELRRRHIFERMRERLGVRDEAVEDAARSGASEQLKCASRWRRGALACPDSVACSDRRGGCPPLDDEIFEERFFLGWFLLDDAVLEKLRRAQRLAKAVASGEREVNGFRRAVEEELKEQSFFVAAVADVADAEEAAIGVGEKSVFDAALRKRVVLHAEDEEVIESAAAKLHDIAEPDVWSRLAGVLADGDLFERVDDGAGVEADIHPIDAFE